MDAELGLTDVVDVEALDMNPSEDLKNFYSSESSSKDMTAITEDKIESARKLLTNFEQIQAQYTKQLTQSITEAIFPSEELKEEYYKNIASRLYDEIHKQAKVFIKNWCAINEYTQIWSNPLIKQFSKKQQILASVFIPQVYTLSVKNIRTGELNVLAEMFSTSREATIHAAKSLGFDSSTQKALAFSRFSKEAISVIIGNTKYLREQRELYKFEEHRRQIERRKYIPLAERDKWLEQIQKEFDSKNLII